MCQGIVLLVAFIAAVVGTEFCASCRLLRPVTGNGGDGKRVDTFYSEEHN